MLIEDAKVKELVYSGNTVIFLLPNRECMRENSFFIVAKQNCGCRPCRGYLRLNAAIVPDRYPIPDIEEFSLLLAENTVF